MKTSKQIKENPLSLFKFIPISPGKFIIGSPEDEPGRTNDENQAEVEISKSFEMQETPVTQLQYWTIMGINPSNYKDRQNPVHNISWNDAQRFIDKLNHLDTEFIYRLPTEAEWEYCCRAGTQTPSFCDPNDLFHYAVFESNDGPENVKSHQPNPWGLYDMLGNVWEWCSDWYGETLQGGIDPKGPDTGSDRVLRGSSWYAEAQYLRSACRSRGRPVDRYDILGFRLVRTSRSLSPLTLLLYALYTVTKYSIRKLNIPFEL